VGKSVLHLRDRQGRKAFEKGKDMSERRFLTFAVPGCGLMIYDNGKGVELATVLNEFDERLKELESTKHIHCHRQVEGQTPQQEAISMYLRNHPEEIRPYGTIQLDKDGFPIEPRVEKENDVV
jgi:hypothetical protein